MANYELGQAGLNPRGVYNSTTACKKPDCVSYEGSGYIALMDNTGRTCNQHQRLDVPRGWCKI